ncbi:recA, putative [Babesia ovata]|uniref:RecA, putative n=1 Tax=Babesia ovata TaxID=189622 RepID=A0A2H6KEM3_9APIC|nr:recA, putative [Babesia ovata]GBE61448.1 recA, putative [Babesia ovata]
MRITQGSCTFYASGRTLFRRQSRRFVFSTCPVLANDQFTDVFKGGSVLCIAGPCSSGKSLLALHILADILSSYGAALEAEVSSSFERLVYFPVYDIHDTQHLFVALDVYFQSGDSRVLVIDSLLTKSGTFEDELVETCLRLLIRLCMDHGLLMIFTKREGGGFTLPFSVAALCPHDLPSEKDGSRNPHNVDLLRNILTFGLPVDWIPLDERATKRPFDDMRSLIQLGRKRSMDSTRAFWRPQQDSSDIDYDVSFLGRGRSDSSGVMLCCLPCRRASIDGRGYIGCVYRLDDPTSSTGTITTEADAHTRRPNTRGLIRILPLWPGIEFSEDEDDMVRPDNCPDFEDVRTQDIAVSEQLMMEPTEHEMVKGIVSPCTLHSRNPWSPSTHITMDDDTLRSLKFGLFRIDEDTSLRSQMFCMHR